MPHIRQATEADIQGIFQIYDWHVQNGIATFETKVKYDQEKREWFDSHNGAHQLFVAIESENVIGWAALSPWSPREAYSRTAECSVYVAAEFEGQGIGKVLLTHLLDNSPNIHVVIARIAEPNPASVALHRSAGFQDIGVMQEVGEKFGKLLDVRLMGWHRKA